MITFQVSCIFCGKIHYFTVEAKKFNRWQSGEYIQDVFPEADDDTRETMVSGTCKECWDNLKERKDEL